MTARSCRNRGESSFSRIGPRNPSRVEVHRWTACNPSPAIPPSRRKAGILRSLAGTGSATDCHTCGSTHGTLSPERIQTLPTRFSSQSSRKPRYRPLQNRQSMKVFRHIGPSFTVFSDRERMLDPISLSTSDYILKIRHLTTIIMEDLAYWRKKGEY